MKKELKNLTRKEELAVGAYLIHGDLARAAEDSGYIGTAPGAAGRKLLGSPHVQEELARRKKNAVVDCSIRWVLQRMMYLAENGRTESTRMTALVWIGKHLMMFPTQVKVVGSMEHTVTGPQGGPIQVVALTDRQLATIASQSLNPPPDTRGEDDG